MTTNTGGPVFPIVHPPVEGFTFGGVESYGLTIRDYFAANAIEGACDGNGAPPDGSYCNYLAESAYKLADAMLKARG
jgi:hypothetical protein